MEAMPFYANYQIRVGGRISCVSSFDGVVEKAALHSCSLYLNERQNMAKRGLPSVVPEGLRT